MFVTRRFDVAGFFWNGIAILWVSTTLLDSEKLKQLAAICRETIHPIPNREAQHMENFWEECKGGGEEGRGGGARAMGEKHYMSEVVL